MGTLRQACLAGAVLGVALVSYGCQGESITISGNGTCDKGKECGASCCEHVCEDGVCIDVDTDRENCGKVGHACESGEHCESGVCKSGASCKPSERDCDGVCADLKQDINHCGACGHACGDSEVCSDGTCATACPEGYVPANGGCADLKTDSDNCGGVGNRCEANSFCSEGQCVCNDGWYNCDGDLTNGCESNRTCNFACADGLKTCGEHLCCPEAEACCGEGCCAVGTTCCGGDTCYDLQNDAMHCGGCDVGCRPSEICVEGVCTENEAVCETEGQIACWGVCTDIQGDPKNCGDCGNACREGWSCDAGICTLHCAESLTLCGDMCLDLSNSYAHCGACDTVCGASEVCVDGACVETVTVQPEFSCDEASGETACWGKCYKLKEDRDHCGGCDVKCGDDQDCTDGACVDRIPPNPYGCEGLEIMCYGKCTDVFSDDNNCGACLSKCAQNEKCVQGICELQCGEQTRCGSKCVDLQSNNQFCGSCETACMAGQTCHEGGCVCAEGHYDCDNVAENGCESTTACSCVPGTKQKCWPGAAENRNKGICKDGEQVCNETGQYWGPCIGAVLPSKVTCTDDGVLNGLDNDCDGAVDNVCYTTCDNLAGETSYIGCEYWPVYLENYSPSTKNHGIVISNPSATATATVKIFNQAGQKQNPPKPLHTLTVKPGGLASLVLSEGTTNMVMNTGIQAKAYVVRTNTPITVYQFNPWGKASVCSNDASLLLPRNVLGTKYRGMTWQSEKSSLQSYLTVVAVEPGKTVVSFDTRSTIVAGTGVAQLVANTIGKYTLNQFEVLNMLSTTNAEQTGSYIEADRKIAVYGGSQCSFIPNNVYACDHLEEQLFPIQAWGKSYFAVRSVALGDKGDFWRILAHEDNTQVTLPAKLGGTITLKAGQYKELVTTDSFEIDANKPILVGQFFPGLDYHTSNPKNEGDPAFILDVPYEQYRSEYAFMIPDSYRDNYVTIISPKNNVIRYTGEGYCKSGCSNLDHSKHVMNPFNNVDINSLTSIVKPKNDNDVSYTSEKLFTGFKEFGTKGYVYGYLKLDGGTHKLVGEKPFGVIGYGFYAYTSYGYPIGLDLKVLNTN